MTIAKDIQEKVGYKDKKPTYELKADFDDIYEQVEKEMTAKHIEICFNKIMKGVDDAKDDSHRKLSKKA